MFRILFVFVALAALAFGNPIADELNWDSRIVGGIDAAPGAAPYQVSLRSATNFHFCGGSIINQNFVLSAAHCTIGRAITNTFSVVGTNTLNTGGIQYGTAAIINHPQYNANTLNNDVSLVRTTGNIVFTNNVAPIALGTQFIGGDNLVTLTGWGQTSNPGSAPNNLQIIQLRTLTNEQCIAQHNNANGANIFPEKICTFTQTGQGACMGDSGGPLTYAGSVVGIVSWGIACAVGFPDVFGRVSSHIDWITVNSVV